MLLSNGYHLASANGFYHLMGEDHMKENDKVVMRQKEEHVLNELGI